MQWASSLFLSFLLSYLPFSIIDVFVAVPPQRVVLTYLLSSTSRDASCLPPKRTKTGRNSERRDTWSVSPRHSPREAVELTSCSWTSVHPRQRRRHDEDRPSKAELVVHSQPLAFGAEVVRSSSTSVYIDHISPTTCVNHVVCRQRRNRKVARAVPDSSVLHIHTQLVGVSS